MWRWKTSGASLALTIVAAGCGDDRNGAAGAIGTSAGGASDAAPEASVGGASGTTEDANFEIYEVCGSLADPAEPEDERNGCNPIERIWEQYKKDIAEACSISCGGCDDWDVFCHMLTPFECVTDALHTAVGCPTTVMVGFASVAIQTVHADVHAAVCSILTGGADYARAPIVFDLWSGPRRSAAMRPSGTDLYPKSGGIFFSGSAPKGKIACSEFPLKAPSRFRCVLDPSSDTTDGRCGDALRLRPDCATDVAGGLVEVDWR